MKKNIYLDNNATTVLDQDVCLEMQTLFYQPLNPSSTHAFGQKAKKILLQARDRIAAVFRVPSQEIFFTSGATEALNVLLRGLVKKQRRGRILTSPLEHSAVYQTLSALSEEYKALQIDFLPAECGAVAPQTVQQALLEKGEEVIAICLMAANNETGVKTDLQAIGELARQRGVPFIVDAVAMVGKDPFVLHPGISAFACSAHKFHGPQGAGFFWCARSMPFSHVLTGGGQEAGRRPGTENLAAIVGLAKALELAHQHLFHSCCRLQKMRDAFESALKQIYPALRINAGGPRVCNVSNVCFTGLEGEVLLQRLDRLGVMASFGSACSSGGFEPSRVLRHMGLSVQDALSSLRFSLSRFTSEQEMASALQAIKACLPVVGASRLTAF